MKEENYWQQFLDTGRVDDYLSYVRHKQAGNAAEKGEHTGAGTMQRYRDDIENGTFRGI
jgi:hypothetical protein